MPNLYDHQQKILDTIPDKFGIWARPRTGKTPLAIRIACSRVKSALVIVPKHILEQWQNEIATWNNTDCEFVLYTKERFRIDSIAGVVNKGRRKTLIFSDKIPVCQAVFVDECHRQASNYDNKFFKCLYNYLSCYDVKNVYLLSGTPWNKNPWSVFSYLKLLAYNPDWYNWQSKYFTRIAYGVRAFYKPNPAMFPELVKILQKMGVTVRLEDVANIEEDYEETEHFDLNAEQKKNIKLICDTTPMARNIKQHQLEQGVLKSNGYEPGLSFDCEKDTRILELAEDYPKLIIVCKFLDQIEKYKQALTKAGKCVYIIKGEMDRPVKEVAEEANTQKEAVVIVQADKSDGFDLKGFSTMVFASMSYSFVSYDQMTQRMKSMAKTEGCTYIYLITRGNSMDKAVYTSVKAGQDFSDSLYERS